MIEAITFDLWNTLFQDKSYSSNRITFLNDFLTKIGYTVDLDIVKKCYNRIFLQYDKERFERIDRHIYNDIRIEKVLDCLNTTLSSAEKEEILLNIEREMLSNPPFLKPGVPEVLKELKLQYKIGLISNTGITPGRIIKQVLKDYSILKYFHTTIFSDEIGYYKPNYLLFHKALKHLKTKPENSIHVGDLLHTDIKGAKDYGMFSIWFNDLNRKSDYDIIPDFEVKSMREIVKVIKNL